ncbi:MAG: hypothetical protein PHQ05_05290 [Sterolibacterium sp.]|nr:hypothetical protein [Sterolibacterium sp.]
MNHEWDSFFTRTLVYASHIDQGDFFPLWSSADNGGFGSAQPALYHKLFYMVSGNAYALIGSMKAAILLTVWGWLVIGAYGTYRLCREIGCGHGLAVCGGVMLLFANYTNTNYLVRGAMAEFAAAMLAPWCLAFFLQSIRNNLVSAGFSVSLALIFLAHSTLAYFMGIITVLTGLCLIFTKHLPLKIMRITSIGRALIIFGLLAGPYLFAMALLGQDYDMQRIIPLNFLPENQIKALGLYFWDSQWQWGRTWQSYTVQLDFPLTVLMLSSGAVAVWFHIRSIRMGSQKPLATPFLRHAPSSQTIAMMLVGGMAMFMQTRSAIPIYRHVPGAAFLQFPWRLLAIITPASIALALLSVQHIFTPGKAFKIGVAALLAMFFSCGNFAPLDYSLLPDKALNLDDVRFSAFGEYVPKHSGKLPILSAKALREQMEKEGCSYDEELSTPENLVRRFNILCRKELTVALPVFSSPAHLIVTPYDTGLCINRPDLPALCAVQLPIGESTVEVHLPAFGTIIRAMRLGH